MIKNTTFAAVLIVVAGLFGPSTAAVAQDADPVVVRVNGYDIRTSEVSLAAETISTQLANLPPQSRYPFVVQYLIERHLLAAEARRQNIEQDAEYKKLLAYYQAKAARDAFFLTRIKPTVTEEAARAEYDKQAGSVDNQQKVKLRHILVADEAAAKKIHEQLASGADFVTLANENSPDKNVQDGGDLGWLDSDEMFPEFIEATAKLNAGEFSQPVKTKFGWHVILVEEKNVVTVQPFDKIKNGLVMLLTRQKVQAIVNALKGKAEIEVVDPDLKKLQKIQENQ